MSLCNIVLNSIGNIWWNKDIHSNGIGYGSMTVNHHKLRVVSHGTLFLSIQIWLGIAKCYGVSIEMAMGKNSTIG
jgi:hypothetical protein